MLIAVYLPWLEVFVGAAFVARKLSVGAAALSTVMAVIFLGAIASAWSRGLDITCGCLGHDEGNRTNYPLHIALDAALLVASLASTWLESRLSARPAALTR